MHVQHPLHSAGLHRSSNRAKKGDKVCENAAAPVGFKTDVWKHLPPHVSRDENGGKTENINNKL